MPLVNVRVQHFVVDDAVIAFADAGEDQSVFCASVIQLQGEILGDNPANHTFEWEQTFGTPVTLINPDTLFPSFINPQVSDLEFTLYVDRGTPFETSDTVVISRVPTSTMRQSASGATVESMTTLSPNGSFSSISAGANTSLNTMDMDLHISSYSYNYPPDHTYSPIYKAEDLRRIGNNLNGRYWLMQDIDMSKLDRAWEPLGTSRRPFSGELQGNGFSIQNLTIETTPIEQQTSDADFSNVVLLVDFDGVDEATSETDSSNSAHSLTFNGTTKLDNVRGANRTGQTTSLLCNSGSSDNVTIAATSDFDFSTGDFTVECDVYFDNALSTENNEIITTSSVSTGWGLGKVTGGTHGAMRFRFGSNSFTSLLGPLAPAASTWHTMAVSRVGSNVYLFFNGTLLSTNNIAAAAPTAGARSLYIGTNSSITFDEMDGAIGNVRITKGVGRYTSTYTPSSDPFSSITYKPVGLFSHIGNGAVIEQVGITNASITNANSSIYKGILAGSAQGPSTDDGGAVTVRNVYVSGTVDSGGNLAGGLIGHTGANVSSAFENTYADVTVTGGGTSAGGWAGYFDTTATYNDNFWNSDKTAAGVGTDGDAPIAGELDALTTAQLQVQSNYTNWDFGAIWQMPELKDNIGPAQLQNDIFGRIADGTGTALDVGDKQAVAWRAPATVVDTSGRASGRRYLGAIIQDQNPTTKAWENARFIPGEQQEAILTPGRRHRIFAVIDSAYTSSYRTFKQGKREVTYLMPDTVVTKGDSPGNIFAGATTGFGNSLPSGDLSATAIFEITNPKKTTFLVTDTMGLTSAGVSTTSSAVPVINTFTGADFVTPTAETTEAMAVNGSNVAHWVSAISITRSNGASIG